MFLALFVFEAIPLFLHQHMPKSLFMSHPRYCIRVSQYDPSLHNKLVCTTVHTIDADEATASRGMQTKSNTGSGKGSTGDQGKNAQGKNAPTQGQTLTFPFRDTEWCCTIRFDPIDGHPGCYDVKAHIKLKKGQAKHCNVGFECIFDNWSTNNYVLLPAAAYNGNRFESRRIAYSPKLFDPRDIGPAKAPIISDVPRLNISEGPSEIHDRSGAVTTPSIGFYAPATSEGFWLLTTQATRLGDYGYKITETRDRRRSVLSVSAPVVRELNQYHIADNQYPSTDHAPDWQEGDSVDMRISLFSFDCPNIQALFTCWNDIRHHLIPRPAPLMSVPFSSTFNIQMEKFNRDNWVEQHGYYSVGMREMFLQDWQTGWTGGMITTYPLLFHGDDVTRQRVLRNFDFLFPKGISPSGFFWDSGETSRGIFHWYGGDIRKPHTANWHLIRKSADALYYIIKQFKLMRAKGIPVKPGWEEGTWQVAEAFLNLWKTHGQFGQFVDARTGMIVVGGSTSAGIAPAALALTADYFKNPSYLSIAEEAAEYYYHQFVCNGLSMGGPGDALQNPDSESAYGLLESFALLFEHTGKKAWLDRAEAVACQFATWVMGYDYVFPEASTLGKLGVKTRGAVFANTQNKHGSPGICTHSGLALLRLFRATGKKKYLELLRDIARFIPQMLSHPKNPTEGMPIGWMTERVSTTDWFEGIGELMYGSTWAETALMLTATEIPAVYVIPDKDFAFAFDALEARLVDGEDKPSRLWLKNPSGETVTATIMAETAGERAKPLGENALLHCRQIHLQPGNEDLIDLQKTR